MVLQKLDAIYDQERQFVKLIACDRKIASTYNIVHFRGTERNYWALTDLESRSTQEEEILYFINWKLVETWNINQPSWELVKERYLPLFQTSNESHGVFIIRRFNCFNLLALFHSTTKKLSSFLIKLGCVRRLTQVQFHVILGLCIVHHENH